VNALRDHTPQGEEDEEEEEEEEEDIQRRSNACSPGACSHRPEEEQEEEEEKEEEEIQRRSSAHASSQYPPCRIVGGEVNVRLLHGHQVVRVE